MSGYALASVINTTVAIKASWTTIEILIIKVFFLLNLIFTFSCKGLSILSLPS